MKPKKDSKTADYKIDSQILYQLLSGINDDKELKLFLQDLLTPSEVRMIQRRWHVATLLFAGKKMRQIAQITGVSTQTVARIKSQIKYGRGKLRPALNKASTLKTKITPPKSTPPKKKAIKHKTKIVKSKSAKQPKKIYKKTFFWGKVS